MSAVLEYDHNVFDARQEEADRSLLVKFYPLPIQNDEKSVNEGRPIFDDVEMIEIRVRGTKDNIVVRPVRPDDAQRFRQAYRAYKDNMKAAESGTPLAQWPILTLSQVEELKYLGFTTVEHLAAAGDNVIAKVMGLQTLKTKALAFLEFSKGAAPLEQMQRKIDEKANEVNTMQEQIRMLQQRLDTAEASAKAAKAPLAIEKVEKAAPSRS